MDEIKLQQRMSPAQLLREEAILKAELRVLDAARSSDVDVEGLLEDCYELRRLERTDWRDWLPDHPENRRSVDHV